jgi:coenzyme F420-reducing hydrogenase delta subunit/ferredoxin
VKASAIESVFLTRNSIRAESMSKRVLVLGGDQTGVDLALRLADEGFEVLLTGETGVGQINKGINLFPDAVLEQVQGFVGCFDCLLRTSLGPLNERVGFIVAAQPAGIVPKYENYGLAKSPKVISLSDLEVSLQSMTAPAGPSGEWFHAAFLLGLKDESQPAVFARVLDAIEKLQERGDMQTYVFTRHLKVAAAGLERRYRECRERGTLFFKFDDAGPSFENSPDGPMIAFTDPLLHLEMDLEPDLLVVDEDLLPPAMLEPLFHAIPSSKFAAPFLKPESTRFTGVETPKAGILAVGASRGVFDPEIVSGDIEAVIAALKRFTPEPQNEQLPGPPEVDPAKCTMCLTCVRLCPHGAISFSKQAEADSASCTRCGICAAECPMQAIKLAPAPQQLEIAIRIRDCLVQDGATGKIAAFLCSRSAAQAMESMGSQISNELLPITVACAGTVALTHILTAFESGAEGVIVAGCFKGNCASVYGTLLAADRVNQVQEILLEAGIDPDRVTFVSTASNTPGILLDAVRNMAETIARPNKLGNFGRTRERSSGAIS